MPTPEPTRIPVHTAAERTQRWRTLLEPPVFAARSLWLTWFDEEGCQLPVVVPVDELPERPDWETVRGLLRLHDTVVEQSDLGEGHLAMALCRPGSAVVTEDDEDWAEVLHETVDGQLDGTWSLHLAAAGAVLPMVEESA
jgi:hypothetical protein